MLEELISLRKTRGLSQENIAKQLGISRSTYSGYENGYYEIPFKSVITLKRILKTKKDEIFLKPDDRK